MHPKFSLNTLNNLGNSFECFELFFEFFSNSFSGLSSVGRNRMLHTHTHTLLTGWIAFEALKR